MQPLPPMFPLTADGEISEDFLVRRFSQAPKQPEPITYEITRDAGYLHQYFRLRDQMFIRVWGAAPASSDQDADDDLSDIMVARRGNHVIGGGRLTFRDAKTTAPLPMEKNGVVLSEHLPELSSGDASSVEISRLAILPEFEDSAVLLSLSRRLLERAVEKKARYAFMLATPARMRHYQKAASLLNLIWESGSRVATPDHDAYEGATLTLAMLDLAPAQRRAAKTAKTTGKSLATA